MFLAGLLLFIALICSFIYALQVYSKLLADFGHIPCMKSWHLIGDTFKLLGNNRDFHNCLVKFTEDFRGVGLMCLWLSVHPIVIVFKDEYVQDVIGNSKHINKNTFYKFVTPWLGDGLLTSGGSKWFKFRKILTPSFHYNILNYFLSTMVKQSNILCNKLDVMVGKGEFNICPFITNCTLDIITETAMGKCVNAQENEDSEYIKNVNRIVDIIMYRSKSPWLEPDFLFNLHPMAEEMAKCLKYLHDFTDKVIEDRLAIHLEERKKNSNDDKEEKYGKKKMAFLDTLLDKLNDGEITKRNIREEVDTFMFEGHDTTAAGLKWVIYFIASHPHVQHKLQKEIDAYYGETDEPTQSNLKKLTYLEAVIKESLRLYPPAPFFGRVAAEDFKIGPYDIKKGTNIVIGIAALHRDPEIYPDPLTFNPDRFLTEDLERHPYAFIPFSAGPRNCIGQKFAILEEKIILSRIIQRFSLETTQKEEELEPSCDLILKPFGGVRVKLSRRQIACID
ncbi:cytochrome P450 4V2 isoform X1 [Argonauta hians]